MRQLTRLSAALLFSLTCVPPGSAGSGVPLGQNPILGGGVFTTGGGITIALEPREINGAPHLCGVWARSEFLSAYIVGKVSFVLAQGVVQVGKDIVLRDFRVFPQVAVASSYAGAEGSCVAIAFPVEDMAVRFPKLPLVRDRGGEGVFVRVDFTQTDKENPAFTNGSLQKLINSAIQSEPQS